MRKFPVNVQGKCPERGSGTAIWPAEGKLPAGVQQIGCQHLFLAGQGGGIICNEVRAEHWSDPASYIIHPSEAAQQVLPQEACATCELLPSRPGLRVYACNCRALLLWEKDRWPSFVETNLSLSCSAASTIGQEQSTARGGAGHWPVAIGRGPGQQYSAVFPLPRCRLRWDS